MHSLDRSGGLQTCLQGGDRARCVRSSSKPRFTMDGHSRAVGGPADMGFGCTAAGQSQPSKLVILSRTLPTGDQRPFDDDHLVRMTTENCTQVAGSSKT